MTIIRLLIMLVAGIAAAQLACGAEFSARVMASHYFSYCGMRSLDGNGDSVPCESLCRPVPEGTLN